MHIEHQLTNRFYIRPSDTTSVALQIQAVTDAVAGPAIPLPVGGYLTQGVWSQVYIPLSSLGVLPDAFFSGFWLQVTRFVFSLIFIPHHILFPPL